MLYLIRGLPGSGKSTLAKLIMEGMQSPWKCAHLETDMYFVDQWGEYKFSPNRLKEAHTWCQERVRDSLGHGYNVIVSNTFTQRWELQPYLDMAKEFDRDHTEIICRGQFESVHGVPQATIDKMRERWED